MAALPSSRNNRRLMVEARSPEETRRLAVTITPLLLPGDVIALAGDLGVGKTTFVQGLAAGLGIMEKVTSPTFVLMKEYVGGRYPLMHIDVYRLGRMQEVIDLGYEEFLDPSHIVVVEWGDMVTPLLPKEHLLVELAYGGGDLDRTISVTPRGPQWEPRMETMRILASELFSATRDPNEDPRLPWPRQAADGAVD